MKTISDLKKIEKGIVAEAGNINDILPAEKRRKTRLLNELRTIRKMILFLERMDPSAILSQYEKLKTNMILHEKNIENLPFKADKKEYKKQHNYTIIQQQFKNMKFIIEK